VADNGVATGQLDPLPPVTHPLVAAAARLAGEVLIPSAEEVDRSEVPIEHVRLIAAAGLLAPTAPAEIGGGGAPDGVGRAVTEVLSGASGATWFVCTQHGTPWRLVLAGDNDVLRERLLRPLASGSVLAGIALAHLRRPGTPAVSGTPSPGGWSVSGEVAWLTSWRLADLVLLGFRAGPDVVFALVPAAEGPGFSVGGLLPLAAMQAARTVSVRLDGFFVADADVALRTPYDAWSERDAAMTANVTPAVFGLLRPVLARMRWEGERRHEPATAALAERMGNDAAALRAAAYRLIDDVPAGEAMADRLAIRAEALELVTAATAALVAAGAGASMALTHPAQRWAREALFHLIQAQTAPVRAATMQRFLSRG
jgi:alkylation response protein AidB-like acyl-CoA dehydrogenase